MSSDEWVESGRDTSGVGRLGYDDGQTSKLINEQLRTSTCKYAVKIYASCVVEQDHLLARLV